MKISSVLVTLAAVSASLLASSTALAEGKDRARVRGGVAVAGGVLTAPEAEVAMGTGGVQGQVGVQINDVVGLYWVPQIDLGLGSGMGGVNLSTAIMVDISPIDFISIGAGPDLGFFAGIGDDGAAAGANYGGRFRFAVHPFVSEGKNHRRQAFTLAADLRVLAGATLATNTGGTTGFVMQPMLTAGWTAF
jgi:hypothetical protein